MSHFLRFLDFYYYKITSIFKGIDSVRKYYYTKLNYFGKIVA